MTPRRTWASLWSISIEITCRKEIGFQCRSISFEAQWQFDLLSWACCRRSWILNKLWSLLSWYRIQKYWDWFDRLAWYLVVPSKLIAYRIDSRQVRISSLVNFQLLRLILASRAFKHSEARLWGNLWLISQYSTCLNHFHSPIADCPLEVSLNSEWSWWLSSIPHCVGGVLKRQLGSVSLHKSQRESPLCSSEFHQGCGCLLLNPFSLIQADMKWWRNTNWRSFQSFAIESHKVSWISSSHFQSLLSPPQTIYLCFLAGISLILSTSSPSPHSLWWVCVIWVWSPLRFQELSGTSVGTGRRWSWPHFKAFAQCCNHYFF